MLVVIEISIFDFSQQLFNPGARGCIGRGRRRGLPGWRAEGSAARVGWFSTGLESTAEAALGAAGGAAATFFLAHAPPKIENAAIVSRTNLREFFTVKLSLLSNC